MTSYVLTPGQQDILRGSYGRDFVDRNVIAVAVRAPERIDGTRLARAVAHTARSHPALRTAVVDDGCSPGGGRQEVRRPSEAAPPVPVLVESRGGDLHDELTDQVRAAAGRFDVAAGTVWGVVRHRGPEGDHLLFVVNHMVADLLATAQFVRTLVRAYLAGGDGPPVRDTYLEHLTDLAQAWEAEPTEDVQWWWDRPWSDLPDLVDAPAATGTVPVEPVVRLDVVSDTQARGGRLSEATLLDAVDRSLRDAAGLDVTRIDVSTHGRTDGVSRTAAGWLSHALPCIGRAEGDHRDAQIRAAAWPVAFPTVRRREDLSMTDHLRAHAFVNFFGTFDPRRWSLGGFRMSTVQPRSTLPHRVSLTPIRLIVRRDRDRWTLAWTLGGPPPASPVPTAVADRVVDLLTCTRP